MGGVKINQSQIKRFWGLVNRLGWQSQYRELLEAQTEKTSLRSLSMGEAQAVILWLQKEVDSTTGGKQRKAIIHYLCLPPFLMVHENDKPDMQRINNFIRVIGSNNPRKVDLNYLDRSELNRVLSQVKAMYEHELTRD